MSRKYWSSLLVAVVTVASLAGPAGSMTSRSQPDGDDHPAVVALLVDVGGGSAFQFCSGTLVTPSVVVSASHCVSAAERFWGAARVLVTNDPVLTDDSTGRTTVADLEHVSRADELVVNPAYRPGVGVDSYREDVSALTVEDPAALDRPGGVTFPALPEAGLLDRFRGKTLRSTTFTLMGYGTEEQVVGPGGPTFPRTDERRLAEVGANALDGQFLHESQQIHRDEPGACYGDSGGPTFVTLDGEWTIVGVTSTGDIPCWSTNTAARIDRQTVLEFLAPLVAGTG